jgi:hypothetical protein
MRTRGRDDEGERAALVRRRASAALLVACVLAAACKQEEAWPEPATPAGAERPGPTAPSRPTQTAPPQWPPAGPWASGGAQPGGYGLPYPGTPAPRPPAVVPAAGLACRTDGDLVCPFARCVGGRCGGCTSSADCKPGASCAWTPLGAACVIGLPAAGTPASLPMPGGGGAAGGFEAERQACVDKTNELRARAGVAPLARRTDVEACSDTQAASDGNASQAHGAFGRCGESAQNECPSWNGPPGAVVSPCLQAMFDEGPGEPYQDHGHYINMTGAKYTGVACGFTVLRNGRVWMVQDFY